MLQNSKVKLTSSRAGSPASHSVPPGSAKARQMTVTSGRTCLGLLAKSGRHGLWGKTFTALLIGRKDWYSTRCNLTWKLKDTKSRRSFCQLQVSMLRIKDTGSGLWHTILDMPPKGNRKIIPTPTGIDGSAPSLAAKLRKCETPATASTLTSYIHYNWQKLLPTPIASDARHKRKSANWRGDDLASQIQERTGQTGHLNPRFVAEMMGFPPDWTELPFQAGNHNPSSFTAMP